MNYKHFKKRPSEVFKKRCSEQFCKIHEISKEYFYTEHLMGIFSVFFDSEYSDSLLALHHPLNKSFQIDHDICVADI